MNGGDWVRFEGHEGRYDPGYRGMYVAGGVRFALESKGPRDRLKPAQIGWFRAALRAGVDTGDLALAEWRAAGLG